MAQDKGFAKTVKKALIDREWTFSDLANAVSSKTGLFCDQSYISKILSGSRSPEKIVEAINEILNLEGGEGLDAGRDQENE